MGRRHGSIHDDSKAEREVGLTQGCSYTDTAGNIIPMGCLYAQYVQTEHPMAFNGLPPTLRALPHRRYDNLHDVYTADAVNFRAL